MSEKPLLKIIWESLISGIKLKFLLFTGLKRLVKAKIARVGLMNMCEVESTIDSCVAFVHFSED